ncbi:b-box zinc finger family protein [Stylonychia lemnae]|uniref:B-box zinc finger family protein n=1 Tax=Stylonychia lemnae TaxID=5949 RepID=A0A077ZNR1_STYLE|nr:b-box zinc finger family protein [Stylonychia lemnae]|eukprot:CDW71558.1 b-box zinc finger family protein [Stylonychia lemnae]
MSRQVSPTFKRKAYSQSSHSKQRSLPDINYPRTLQNQDNLRQQIPSVVTSIDFSSTKQQFKSIDAQSVINGNQDKNIQQQPPRHPNTLQIKQRKSQNKFNPSFTIKVIDWKAFSRERSESDDKSIETPQLAKYDSGKKIKSKNKSVRSKSKKSNKSNSTIKSTRLIDPDKDKDKFKELALCESCLQRKLDYIQLDCVHYMCYKCIDDARQMTGLNSEQTNQIITCIVCDMKQEIDVIELLAQKEEEKFKKLKTLKSNRQTLKELVKAQRPDKPPSIKRKDTQNEKAKQMAKDGEYECLNCNFIMCTDCKNKHKNHVRFKNHAIIVYVDVETHQQKVENDKCIFHKEQLKLFCVTCSFPLCMLCVEFEQDHQFHEIRTLKQRFQYLKTQNMDYDLLDMKMVKIMDKTRLLLKNVDMTLVHLLDLEGSIFELSPFDNIQRNLKRIDYLPISGRDLEKFQKQFSKSKILNMKEKPMINKEMISLFPRFNQASLIFKLTEDGLGTRAFHKACDNKGATIMLVKANKHYIFGGFNPQSYMSENLYLECEDAFIFSLARKVQNYILPNQQPHEEQSNISYVPIKCPVRSSKLDKAIKLNEENFSPGFGESDISDLFISFKNPKKSYSLLGNVYKLPYGMKGDTFLAGKATDWDIQEIEIFAVGF